MALITSTTSKEAPRMTDQIAQEDITEVNALGQTVVIVAKGQPIPEGMQDKAKPAATQDKAKRSSRQKG